jgi:hypothetical protein
VPDSLVESIYDGARVSGGVGNKLVLSRDGHKEGEVPSSGYPTDFGGGLDVTLE